MRGLDWQRVIRMTTSNAHNYSCRATLYARMSRPPFFVLASGSTRRAATIVELGADDAAVAKCSDCGAPLRPGVVWFGESIPEAALNQSLAAAGICDLVLSIGPSSVVYPAAGLLDVARDAGGYYH
jgi:hypothetical protein